MRMFITGWLMGYAPCLVILGPRLMKPIPEASVITTARGKGDGWSHGSNIKPFSWKEWTHIPFLISLAKEDPMATLSPRWWGNRDVPGERKISIHAAQCLPHLYNIICNDERMKKKIKWENWSSDLYGNAHHSLINIEKLLTYTLPHLSKKHSSFIEPDNLEYTEKVGCCFLQLFWLNTWGHIQ